MKFLHTASVLRRAHEKRAKFQAEIEKLDSFIALYEELGLDDGSSAETDDTANTASVESTIDNSKADIISGGLPQPSRQPGMSQTDFEDFVRAILMDNGRPLFNDDILAKIHSKGRRVGGTDEMSNLKTKLWRAKTNGRLVLIPGAGFWVPELPCVAVEYVPPGQGVKATPPSSEKTPARTFSTVVAEMVERQPVPSSSHQWETVAPALKK